MRRVLSVRRAFGGKSGMGCLFTGRVNVYCGLGFQDKLISCIASSFIWLTCCHVGDESCMYIYISISKENLTGLLSQW